ncbi:DEAD/DEAH box helicase [Dermatophilus congolensis]|uniref:DEAD/DEAH box helicase n=1 Tax=Dermatophilus congolensis TaxID=1863 RepID=UPI001AAE57EA|nr:DEAD/DEAH box helicase [Dermatophilus congolensis]MBO3142823.1 DEAD/DEAH box helicase [Dermatophilus congolensis]MBO3151816.1 DEAD/DEAH box helicase [Dermatophilus congolensis]MBO3161181.1 DEAD/DEAH box helicase [Dermatophilus congolensis]MBO3163098.1 DEAD/DEAH box helicase [Dermatophilus congolensis]MBO3176652.1 DEAD/DEAH box helicase [Dermatophilus congolensis]
MSSPAERYARSRAKGVARHRRLVEFCDLLDFPLDDFQERACAALEDGRGVLVAAPTGAGKTIVGEFAVHLALARGQKAFYTTPIKALSNQKYHDLVARYGVENVGLLTGDSSINGEAPVVVMTTEVLRNMMYAGSDTLRGLAFVVMDEVHYLADRARGAVWEEVIIHLPGDVQVAALSATVSNAEEFGDWLGAVRGDTEVVVEEHRPVPLWQHMMVGTTIYDLFVDAEPDRADTRGTGRPGAARQESALVNPDLIEAIRSSRSNTDRRGRLEDRGAPRGRRGRQVRGRGADRWHAGGAQGLGGGRGPAGVPSRAQVIDRLDRAGLLPAITFIFSRVGCDAAVTQLLSHGTRLTSTAEAEEIRRIVESRVAGLAAEDLSVLHYWEFVEAASRGFAAHHAGMLPAFREIVEELFLAGYVRAVFATETLALGVNMPARTVVLEKLVKFNGETHADITPAEYTQLTGRAGRRGIDIEGHAVVLWNPRVDPLAVGGLASTRTYPLRSSFRPTYNMAVNLVGTFGRVRAREILETSFAQFQADRSVVGMAKQLTEHEEALAGYGDAMTCHMGDFREYSALRHELGRLEKDAVKARSARQRSIARASLEDLRWGDVVFVRVGRHQQRGVVVPVGHAREVVVCTQEGRLFTVDPAQMDEPLVPVGHVRLPRKVNYRNPKVRKDVAALMRDRVPDVPPDFASRKSTKGGKDEAIEGRVAELRKKIRSHPCHGCADREQHARWAERWWRLERETQALRRRVESRTNSVARVFDRTCTVLERFGYLAQGGESVTERGGLLSRIYTERDLLTAECLRAGVWDELDAPQLAAAVSCLVNEPRKEEREPSPRGGGAALMRAHDEMVQVWSGLEDAESDGGVSVTAYPDPGIAHLVYAWAKGRSLESVLAETDLAAGDFVRRCKQVVDLLDQIMAVAPTTQLSRTARSAVDAVMRGVVAADRMG